MTYVINFLTGVLPILLLYLLIHLFKMMRMYLVLIDQKIGFLRFVFAYCRTTLVNLAIPFKLGEVYRVAVFYRLSKSMEVGLLSVIVDRFFDTLGLVLIMLPLQLLYPDTVSSVSVFFVVFLAVIVFIYCIFPPTYRYLNRYIIINRGSPRSMAVLRSLSTLKVWYTYVKQLVSGRYAILLLMSLAAWAAEGGLIAILWRLLFGEGFEARVFCDYIASILNSAKAAKTIIQKPYSDLCIALMLFFTILSGLLYLWSVKKTDPDGKAVPGA
ncbi:MAG: hypothetical protein IJT16_06970 [Lachnospiraceae bacterium]|nr:hypothetical protein [Lachnospiraceae bacterium]